MSRNWNGSELRLLILGPGLLENVYEICLAHELGGRRLKVERQLVLPVVFDSIRIDAGYRVDLRIEEQIIVEVKAVEAIDPIHVSQLLTYLRVSGGRLGYVINFNVRIIKNGIQRLVI